MKSIFTFIIAFISIISIESTPASTIIPDTLLNYCPLDSGNRYQYFKTIAGRPLCYSSFKFNIMIDTTINENKYYLVNGTWERIDSTGKLFIYSTYSHSDVLYMDFSLDSGQTLGNKQIITGITNIFDKNVKWKGFDYSYSGMSDYSQTIKKWGYGIGDFYTYYAWSGPGTGLIEERTYLIQLIESVFDSVYSYSHNYYPEIIFVPQDSTISFVVNFNFVVDHYYTRIFPPCIEFQFIDFAEIDGYYKKNDSVITTNPKIQYSNSTNKNFNIVYNLDTTLLGNGFDFYYRIQAKDKGIIPHFSFSPDTGYYKLKYWNPTGLEEERAKVPFKYDLSPNYPNPFNPSTSIQYAISSRQFVTLKVYDVLGNEVAVLVNEEKPAGSYEIQFDGSKLASGVYYYQLKAGEFIETKKMILIK